MKKRDVVLARVLEHVFRRFLRRVAVDLAALQFAQFTAGLNRNAVNGIEGFRGSGKTRMARFRGINRSTFPFHLKEFECRYNHRHLDLYKVLLLLCRKHPLSSS